MPQVSINYHPAAYRIEDILEWLHDHLPVLIANHLGIPGDPAVPGSDRAQLAPEHVGFEEPRPFGPRTISAYKLEIKITIHDYPERVQILQSGCQAIYNAIASQFGINDSDIFYIWSPFGWVFIDKRAEPEALPHRTAS